jgi:flavorubredoxin
MTIDPRLIAMVAKQNRHIEEMLELQNVATKHGMVVKNVNDTLNTWVQEWLDNNPNQARLFKSRLGL